MKHPNLNILTTSCLALAMCIALPSCQQKDSGATAADAATDAAATATPAGHTNRDNITFGHYEQDDDTTNDKEPITWLVLDKNDKGQYLIISEKVLDVKPYNVKPSKVPIGGYQDGDSQIVISANTGINSITWENSTIRSWLNGYDESFNTVGDNYTNDNFIDTAFTAEEKAMIVSSNISADSNPNFSTPPGNATTDKIFLLSIAEVQNYFSNDANRLADATNYTMNRGADIEATSDEAPADAHHYTHWWLRTPGDDIDYAAVVDNKGNIFMEGAIVDIHLVGVRPVLWVQY